MRILDESAIDAAQIHKDATSRVPWFGRDLPCDRGVAWIIWPRPAVRISAGSTG